MLENLEKNLETSEEKEQPEVVEAEVVDVEETNEEVNEETEVQEIVEVESDKEVEEPAPVVEEQEPEDVLLEKDLGVSEKTYIEFFNVTGGWKSSIRSTLLLCVLMCLILYMFADKETLEWPKLIAQMGIYVGIIIAVTAIFQVITRYLITPKQYKKSNLQGTLINFKFSNLGIRQSVEGQSVLVRWEMLLNGVETNNSFFFIGSNRRGLLFSKDTLTSEECDIIRGLVQAHMGPKQFKDKRKAPKEPK